MTVQSKREFVTIEMNPAEEWEAIFNSIADPISIHDTNFNIVKVNKACAALVKGSLQELIGKSCCKIFHGTKKPIPNCPNRQTLKTKETVTEEFFEPKLGVYLRVTTSPIFNEYGVFVGSVHIAKDISEQKRVEAELQIEKNKLQSMFEAKDRFQDFFDNAPVGYHSFKSDRIFHEINKAELDMIGFSRDEIVGKKTWADLILPEQKPIFERHWKQINKTGSVRNIEYTLVHKNGRHIDVLLSATMMYDREGKPVRTRGIVIDITEHKRMEEELQSERNKLQSIIESAQDCLSIQNLDYDIIYQNEILRNTFGHLGEKCYKVYEGKDKVCDGCPVEMAFKDGKSHVSERKIVMPSGEIAYWENMANPIRDANGKIVSCLEVARDVTKRKRMEEALKESESELKDQKKSLEQKNMALKEILEHIEIEKKQIKDDVVVNVEKILLPIVEKLKMKGASNKYTSLLRQNLRELTSSFGRNIIEQNAMLTPREIEICNMVKNGLASKEMASLLSTSYRTIERHRANIRRKLKITNKRMNLTSFLREF